ncbi:NACHT N-terminal Helical domain 1-containing protein [Streptomyces sp. NPDC002446]
MEAAAIGARLASSVVAPLIKRLFVADGPGAGLVDRPLRVSKLVSFKGENEPCRTKICTRSPRNW